MSADQSNEDHLRLDYNETTDLMRALTDVRFKLVAFVPTISGAAIAVLGHGRSTSELLAVGLLGLVATVGNLVCRGLMWNCVPVGMAQTKQVVRVGRRA
jgi:hypothetical protein